MQLFATEGYENAKGHENKTATKGLNLIEGEVLPFQTTNAKKKFKVPHIGWNRLKMPNNLNWSQTILEDLGNENDLYFVHSYYVKPKYDKNCLSKCNYADTDFCAVIKKDNVYGCQFHPEKSGPRGLNLLQNYFS